MLPDKMFMTSGDEQSPASMLLRALEFITKLLSVDGLLEERCIGRDGLKGRKGRPT